jgi:hypothetical protein
MSFCCGFLERQTFPAVEEQDFGNRGRTQELITSLRKALTQQLQLEEEWPPAGLPSGLPLEPGRSASLPLTF